MSLSPKLKNMVSIFTLDFFFPVVIKALLSAIFGKLIHFLAHHLHGGGPQLSSLQILKTLQSQKDLIDA